jgi:acetyl/propionyl-CoA carboxylase alpha subunit
MAKVMAWGEDRDQAIKTLQRALLELRLEGVKCNVPLLRDILASKEFAEATHHTGSIPKWIAEFGSRSLNGSTNGNGHKNGHSDGAKAGHETNGREIAATIGAAMALAMNSSPPVAATSSWRIHGRREQLLSRTLGNRGWR